MATAAKAKLLLRELKTVKADLAFAKERCAQLEEENKILRENRDKGDHRADDDLVFILIFSSIPFFFCKDEARTIHSSLFIFVYM